MKTLFAAAGFALATTALSLFLPSAPAVAVTGAAATRSAPVLCSVTPAPIVVGLL